MSNLRRSAKTVHSTWNCGSVEMDAVGADLVAVVGGCVVQGCQ